MYNIKLRGIGPGFSRFQKENKGAADVNCMKCGKQIEDTQVFCDDCLEKMKQYPVKPGTVVQLPYRAEEAPVKKPVARKKVLTSEEQLARQRKIIQGLSAGIAALVVALSLTAAALGRSLQLQKSGEQNQIIGRNYSTAAPERDT